MFSEILKRMMTNTFVSVAFVMQTGIFVVLEASPRVYCFASGPNKGELTMADTSCHGAQQRMLQYFDPSCTEIVYDSILSSGVNFAEKIAVVGPALSSTMDSVVTVNGLTPLEAKAFFVSDSGKKFLAEQKIQKKRMLEKPWVIPIFYDQRDGSLRDFDYSKLAPQYDLENGGFVFKSLGVDLQSYGIKDEWGIRYKFIFKNLIPSNDLVMRAPEKTGSQLEKDFQDHSVELAFVLYACRINAKDSRSNEVVNVQVDSIHIIAFKSTVYSMSHDSLANSFNKAIVVSRGRVLGDYPLVNTKEDVERAAEYAKEAAKLKAQVKAPPKFKNK